jgi:hypothetical protein
MKLAKTTYDFSIWGIDGYLGRASITGGKIPK